MAKRKNDDQAPNINDSNIVEEQLEEVEYVPDIDFWAETLTEYGKIGSRQELNLILMKIKNEIQRENEKAKKLKGIVAQRNKNAIAKDKRSKKAKTRALKNLPPAQKVAYKQKKIEEEILAKEAEIKAKQEAQAKKIEDKQKAFEQKEADKQFKVQEKIFMMSLTPLELSDYRFQKVAKKKIEEANAKKEDTILQQKEVANSNILPIGGFLKLLGICIVITAILTYCGTNIYLDTKAYEEKIALLSDGVSEYDEKLDGDMVVGISSLEAGLSVYNQILGNAPIISEQLEILNNTYKWVLDKETTESLGLSTVEAEAEALEDQIFDIQTVVDANTAFVADIDEAYQSENMTIVELRDYIATFGTKIENIKSDYNTLSMPKGLPEVKDAYYKKIETSEIYYQTMLAYLDELVLVYEDLTDADTIIAESRAMRPHSGSLAYKVEQYIDKMDDVVDADKAISAANNNVAYALIIGKKHLEDVGRSLISAESLAFYNDMMKLDDIIYESDKIERDCIDLEDSEYYPDEEPTYNMVILSHISLGTTDEALEKNKELETRIAEITTIPERAASEFRAYTTGLNYRTEYLELQKQYVDSEKEKAALYGDYETAKAKYEALELQATLEKKNNGRTDTYYDLRNQMVEAENAVDDAYDTAYDAADAIQVQMKQIRKSAIAKSDEYKDYMDY